MNKVDYRPNTVLVGATVFKKPKAPSFQFESGFGRNVPVPEINSHRVTSGIFDFTSHIQDGGVVMYFAQKTSHLRHGE